MAGRRLQRNRPPGERGGVRRGQARVGQCALFFEICVCVCVCSFFLVLTQYCQSGLPTREKYHEEYSRDEPG